MTRTNDVYAFYAIQFRTTAIDVEKLVLVIAE